MGVGAHKMPPLPSEALIELPELSDLLVEEPPSRSAARASGTLLGTGGRPIHVVTRAIKKVGSGLREAPPLDRSKSHDTSPGAITRVAHAPTRSLRVGDVLSGKYEILGPLATQDDWYSVRAYHHVFDCEVALKFLRPELVDLDEARARFAFEAREHLKLRSDFIARVFDIDRLENGRPFLIMERLTGHFLRAALADHGRLSVELSLRLALQCCEALAVAHTAGVVHGNLKPTNLFVARLHGRAHLKVLDFGSNAQGQPSRQRMPTVDGPFELPYLSPEQVRGDDLVDERSDIWSLGCVLYEMLTGHSPFLGETLYESCSAILHDVPTPLLVVRPELPVALVSAIERCLAKEPEQRFQTSAELATALAQVASEDDRQHALRCQQLCEEAAPRRPSLPALTTTRISEIRVVTKPRARFSIRAFVQRALPDRGQATLAFCFGLASALMLHSAPKARSAGSCEVEPVPAVVANAPLMSEDAPLLGPPAPLVPAPAAPASATIIENDLVPRDQLRRIVKRSIGRHKLHKLDVAP